MSKCLNVHVDAQASEVQELLTKKLQECEIVFDFNDPLSDLKSKELKRAALNEMIDYISSTRGVLNDAIYHQLIRVVASNAFRPLPPREATTDFDPEDDEPTPEPSWPHLQVSPPHFP